MITINVKAMTAEERTYAIESLQRKHREEGSLSQNEADNLMALIASSGVSQEEGKAGQKEDVEKVGRIAKVWNTTWDVAKRAWEAIWAFFQQVARACVGAWKKAIGSWFKKTTVMEEKKNVVVMPAAQTAV